MGLAGKPALTDMKTALLLLAVTGLLLAGAPTANAAAVETPHEGSDTRMDCAPVIQVVCSTYYFVCRNYLGRCPVE